MPTVATDLGWLRELPREAVELVPAATTSEELATVLAGLLADSRRRGRLAEGGLAFAARHGFASTATALLTAILADRGDQGLVG